MPHIHYRNIIALYLSKTKNCFFLGVEQTVTKFLEMAKQMDCFFLQKRLLLSAQKPEQIVREVSNKSLTQYVVPFNKIEEHV